MPYPRWVLFLAGVGMWLFRGGLRGPARAWWWLVSPLIRMGCRGRRP